MCRAEASSAALSAVGRVVLRVGRLGADLLEVGVGALQRVLARMQVACAGPAGAEAIATASRVGRLAIPERRRSADPGNLRHRGRNSAGPPR